MQNDEVCCFTNELLFIGTLAFDFEKKTAQKTKKTYLEMYHRERI
jgi:hypothetical protein